MTKHTFSAQNRNITGRKVKKLRSQGVIPANIFGKNQKSVNIQVDGKAFKKLLNTVGESTLIYLTIEGEKDERPVLVRDMVIHPVTSELLHVSYNQVSLKEKVTAPVTIVIEGESPAVAEKLGILVQQLDEVEIEALPTDIPEGLKVDISSLTEVDMAIYVKDLVVDTSKIAIQTDPESIIVKIEPLAAEEVVEAPAPAEGEAEAAPAEGGEAPAAETPAEEKKAE